QRLIALLGGLVPLAHAPLVYTTSAIAISALALASFSLPCFRHLVHHDELRILWAIAAASLPAEQELLSTATNVGWYVAIWFALLSVMRFPRQPWQLGLLVGAGTVAIFTTPLTSSRCRSGCCGGSAPSSAATDGSSPVPSSSWRCWRSWWCSPRTSPR